MTLSDGKCQQRSNLQKWIAVINTPRTDTHRIYAMHTLIMTFTFADLTAVDICHPTFRKTSIRAAKRSIELVSMITTNTVDRLVR